LSGSGPKPLIAWLVLRLNQTSVKTVGILIGVILIIAGV
jgi:hypothetical protein